MELNNKKSRYENSEWNEVFDANENLLIPNLQTL